MQFTAAQIAQIINARIEGDASVAVSSFGKIEEAKPLQLSFLANLKYEEFLYTTQASIIIINESLRLKRPVQATLLRVQDAYSAFAVLLKVYEDLQKQSLTGIQQPVHIDDTAKIGEDVFIGAFGYLSANVVIGNNVKIYPGVFLGENVRIGDNTILHAGVKIYRHCIVGKNVIIHAGVVLGGDGFGYAPQADGTFQKIPQMGNVVLEDDVEVGANTTIDRATIGSTLIKQGAKVDNLVQIAHNVEIGHYTVIAAQAGISGSTKIGNSVMIGGQAGFAGHLYIVDGTKINAQSGVTKSILKPNMAVNGTSAFDFRSEMRSQAVYRKLPDLQKRVEELEKIIQSLKPND
jgi:UDP-3-O-[3-hydroxymyristoyl] glucosamine N-acyltransferase